MPDELMPESKSIVTVQQLEEVALKSHAGRKPIANELYGDERYHLRGYEKGLGVDVGKLVAGLREQFPHEVLLAADVNCVQGLAAAELNLVEGVEAFGTGKRFMWSGKSGLPENRYILADANELPSVIPEGSFHLLVSYRSFEVAEKVPLLIPGLRRILRPGGLAVFDLENWFNQIPELRALGLDDELTIVNKVTGQRTPMRRCPDSITGLVTEDDISTAWAKFTGDTTFARFELRKPR